MTADRPGPSRWDRARGGLAVVIVGLCLVSVVTAVQRIAHRPPSPSLGVTGAALGPSLAGAPVRVRIPSIDVDVAMKALGLNPDGSLEVPPYEDAGWYQGRPKPGDMGAAVIAGHVDSTTGPAAFYRLSSLSPGDIVSVDYDDGTRVDFAVRETSNFPKSAFPTEAVYGPTPGTELRLITCGGSFDRKARSYRENVVVWATAVERHPPPAI